ncbi:hypothetical protein BW33_03310 [Pseudomonas sp. RIT288]|nr:hypothetical protein BW33_03310 [Pseudomonas sp. RIT288]
MGSGVFIWSLVGWQVAFASKPTIGLGAFSWRLVSCQAVIASRLEQNAHHFCSSRLLQLVIRSALTETPAFAGVFFGGLAAFGSSRLFGFGFWVLGEYPLLRVLPLAVSLLQRVTFSRRRKGNPKGFAPAYGTSLRLSVPSLRCPSGGIAYGLLRCTSSRCMRLRRMALRA